MKLNSEQAALMRWERQRLVRGVLAWGQPATVRLVAFLVVIESLLVLLPLDAGLSLGQGWVAFAESSVGRLPGGGVVAGLGLLWLCRIAIAWVSLRRLAAPRRRGWSRELLLAVVVGFPLFGWLSLPLAAARLRRRPQRAPWAAVTPRRRVGLRRRSIRWWLSASFAASLSPLVVDGLAAFTAATWLVAHLGDAAGTRVGAWSLSVVVHLLAGVAAQVYCSQARFPGLGARRWARALGTLLFLPSLGSLLGVLGILCCESSSPVRRSGLAAAAGSVGGSEIRDVEWRRARRKRSRWWRELPWWRRPWSPRGDGFENSAGDLLRERKVRTLCRLVLPLGFFQGVGLGLVHGTAGRRPSLLFLAAATICGALFMALRLARRLAGLLRLAAPERPLPDGTWAFAAPCLALAGFGFADALSSRPPDAAHLAATLTIAVASWIGLSGALSYILMLSPDLGAALRTLAAMTAVAAFGTLLAAVIASGDEGLRTVVDLLRLLAVASLPLQLAVGAWYLRWLLWPFVPSDLASSRLPARLRVLLGAGAGSLLVPFASFAIPWWLHLRCRVLHRPEMLAEAVRLRGAEAGLVGAEVA